MQSEAYCLLTQEYSGNVSTRDASLCMTFFYPIRSYALLATAARISAGVSLGMAASSCRV